MPFTDLLPWKRKKKTRVPVKVREDPVRLSDRDHLHADGTARWLGLAPFGVFGAGLDVFGTRMDMVEHDQGFRVTIEMPGMERDDIDVTLSGRRLIIRGEKRDEQEHRARSSYRLRRSQRIFHRSIDLPCQVDPNRVEASLKRGVLTVSLLKAAEIQKGNHD